VTFFLKEARLFEGALKSFTSASKRKRRRRAHVTFIASLIESSDFFWEVREVVQIMASQSPSFSVAYFSKRMSSDYNLLGML